MTSIHVQTGFDALITQLADTRRLTEALAHPLSAEDQTVQSMPDTSPTKWHRAHTTWFFETFILQPYANGYTLFDERFNYLFNSYYEAIGDRHPRPRRGMVTRPGVAEVAAYRRHIDAALDELLAGVDRGDPDRCSLVAALVELGINHEQQHQELLLMDIKHLLAENGGAPAYTTLANDSVADPGPSTWVDFDGGFADIGIERGSTGFRFDNEEPTHQVLLAGYRLADRLVTCGEWLDFMKDGGYDDPRLWLSDGWYKCQEEGWNAPSYWTPGLDAPWAIHTLTGTRPVDPHEPVCHVSFYEADAYATWAGARLPTEFEWEHATTQGPMRRGTLLDGAAGSLDKDRFHPAGAGPAEAGVLRQMIGDCWEWTGSPYRPYPGYTIPDGAIGEYNGKFMINTMVLRGGCAMTPRDHVRPTYRNFFHPHTRWHLSGLRLASDRP